ncbi:MAG TPA: SusC/RagA family TonB-linked outer membrane protein [Gemmatimonadales bacterium]|nr:SusC/RagA family TonB-linked outer membrane protein [Gemmatimonadales bacterium]
MNSISIRPLPGVAAVMLIVALAALLGVSAQIGVAQLPTGSVTGRVTDAAAKRPLVGAQVLAVGTVRRAFTDVKGEFRLSDVPVGEVDIRVQLIGYATAARKLTVAAGETATAEIELAASAVALDEVIVTATGEERSREQGNAVQKLDAGKLVQRATPNTLTDLLNARAPGVEVLPSGGTTGSGTRIRIRGSNSVTLSNEPVLIVNGIRVENGAISSSVGVGGQTPSRLNDFNPEDLESVQIVGGPSASVLYGTDAANGVIQLQTKRGRPGPTLWDFSAETGVLNDFGSYPANYTGLDSLASACTLTRAAVGACTIARVRTFNPIMVNSPFQTGHHTAFNLAASGGSDQTTFYVAGHVTNENGVYSVNQQRNVNLLVNLHQQTRSNLDFQAMAQYANGKLRSPENDNNVFGVLSSGFLGSSDSGNGRLGYGFLTPAQSFSIHTFQNIDRFTGSLQTNYRPVSFLEAHAIVGVDFTNRYDQKSFVPGAIPRAFNTNASLGSRAANPFQIYNWTGNFWGTASFDLTPTLTSNTTVGFQYFHDLFHGVLGTRQTCSLGTDAGSLDVCVQPQTDSETTQEFVTIGRFAEERLGWKNRLFLTGALRSDDNSAFGHTFGNIRYPKVSASWVISEEPFFPTIGWLSSLRLRGAVGASGLHPGPLDALRYYVFTPVVLSSTDAAGVTAGGLGNPGLKPERTNEWEVGFDAELAQRRATLTFTYYDKLSHDALIALVQPPGCGCGLPPGVTGAGTRLQNLGSVSNKGVEIAADARVINAAALQLNVNASAFGVRSRVVKTDSLGSPIIFGLGGFSQRITPGYAPGAYFMVPYTYKDADGNGLLSTSEVQLGTQPVFMGQPFPDHGGTLSAELVFQGRLHLYGLLDGRFGNKLFNSTEQFRCGLSNCQARNDPQSSLADQAAAVANILGTQAGYIQDGGFVKLREISLTYDAPTRWAKKIGASTVSFTVSGRNLHTWTNYRGLDPELNEAGQNNFTTADFLTQPPVRYWIGRANITF